MILLSEKENSR